MELTEEMIEQLKADLRKALSGHFAEISQPS